MKIITLAFVACLIGFVMLAFASTMPRPQEDCAMMDTQRDALYCVKAVGAASTSASLTAIAVTAMVITLSIYGLQLITQAGHGQAVTMQPVPQRQWVLPRVDATQIFIQEIQPIRGLRAQVEQRMLEGRRDA